MDWRTNAIQDVKGFAEFPRSVQSRCVGANDRLRGLRGLGTPAPLGERVVILTYEFEVPRTGLMGLRKIREARDCVKVWHPANI